MMLTTTAYRAVQRNACSLKFITQDVRDQLTLTKLLVNGEYFTNLNL